MTPELAADALVGALLIVTIVVAFRLERRLGDLRAAQDAMAATVTDLRNATARAESAIQGLKLNAEDAGQILDHRIRKARALADEIGLLAQASERFQERFGPAREASNAEDGPGVAARAALHGAR